MLLTVHIYDLLYTLEFSEINTRLRLDPNLTLSMIYILCFIWVSLR